MVCCPTPGTMSLYRCTTTQATDRRVRSTHRKHLEEVRLKYLQILCSKSKNNKAYQLKMFRRGKIVKYLLILGRQGHIEHSEEMRSTH